MTGAWIASQRDRVVAAFAEGGTASQFDLSDVESIDAAALGFLTLASATVHERSDASIAIIGARPELGRLLCAVGLSSTLVPAPGGA
jgi:anti-anti-sigma regulatory factor